MAALIILGGFAGTESLKIWGFLDQLNRPDAHLVDAAQAQDEVYEDIKSYLAVRLSGSTESISTTGRSPIRGSAERA